MTKKRVTHTLMNKNFNYININKACYDAFADEYQARYNAGIVANHLVRIINKALKEEISKESYRILELGCGTGNILEGFKMLQENPQNYIKYNLFAIDFSEKMINYAKDKRTNASIENEDILTFNDDISSLPFTEKERYDIIIMVAFIHLFPYDDAKRILNIVKGWLNPNGLIYIDTTLETVDKDGEITEKHGRITDENGKIITISKKRLRTCWTEKGFELFLDKCGFEIIKDEGYYDNHRDNYNKIWLQRIAKVKG